MNKQFKLHSTILGLALGLLAISSPATAADLNQSFLSTERYEEFAKDLVENHGFERETIDQTLSTAYFQQDIIDRITKPAEGLPWFKYRKIFLKTDRIKQGVKFWQQHRVILDQVEVDTGVPAELIVAIIGVETKFGSYQGKHRVLDALATLGFYYPKRGDFFLSELKHFMLMTREENLDTTQLKGSYAGAMGMPQFISSSYRLYSADYDGDGQSDLWNNPGDAIASVANYFVEHGWQAGMQIAAPVTTIASAEQYLQKHGKPIFATAEILTTLKEKKSTWPEQAALMDFDLESGKEYWLSFNNFYVITRYNHSRLYALAALQLAAAIRTEHHKLEKK